MNIKINLVRLALVGALALSGCSKPKTVSSITDEGRYNNANASYYVDNVIENWSFRLYPFRDRNGDFGMMVSSKETRKGALFYDLDKNGSLETIEVDDVIGRYNRNGQLSEDIKKVNDDLGFTADFFYKRFWREYSK